MIQWLNESMLQSRRHFLIRCFQGAALLPAGMRSLAWPLLLDSEPEQTAPGEFQLHPRYRNSLPLESLFLKVKPGTDDFITEKYADEIERTFSRWSEELRRSAKDVQTIQQIFAPDFSGFSLQPAQSKVVRSGIVEVRRNEFNNGQAITKEAFHRDLHSFLSSFSQILTAEFQVTRIENHGAGPSAGSNPTRLSARVRYELVGAAPDAYRMQRVGYWNLEWERSSSAELRLLAWHPASETQSRSTAPIYVDLTEQAFTGNASCSAQLAHGTDYWRTVLDGACGIDIYGHNGVSVGDIDSDGFDDLYVCQPGGLPNRLFRNRGDGTFEDITASAGVGVLENTACALFIDVDNDGRQDLIVVRANGPMLFMNQGNRKFRQRPDAFQFATPPQGTFTGVAAADYDRDGWLDIYFCLYTYYQGTGQYKYPSPYFDAENGPPNFLMHNNRDGTFRDVTRQTLLDKNNTRYSFCCGWSDYNNDGWPDLFVVNDFGRKNLYRNKGDGTFTDVAAEAGVEDIGAGMGVCWFDYNNDGAQDLYVADMWTAAGERITLQDIFKQNSPQQIRALYQRHAMGNSLFKNRVSPWSPVVEDFSKTTSDAFQSVTESAAVGIGRWAWSCDAWDFDHDGFSDLYIANGMISGPQKDDLNSFFWRQVVAYSPDQALPSHDYEQGWNAINELIRADRSWSGYERNVFYSNNGDGTFSDVSGVVGLDFIEDGRSFALADFDHDGRHEVILKNRNAPQLRFLKNVAEELPPSICFRLRGTKSNRDAIGASVAVETAQTGTDGDFRQIKFVQAGSGFLSQHSKEVLFGLGDAVGPIKATIHWPNGQMQEFRDLPANHRIVIEEGSAQIRTEPFKLTSRRTEQKPNGGEPRKKLPSTVETWLLAPVSAPDFSLPNLQGDQCTLSSFRGKTMLLNFWVGGSRDCQADLRLFSERHSEWAARGLYLLTLNFDESVDSARKVAREGAFAFPILQGSDDISGIYNIVYRYLFDRHRDLRLPASFLVNGQQEIVKVYQGPLNPDQVEYDLAHIPNTNADRLAQALPFAGMSETTEFGRNYLSYGSVFFQRGYMDQAAAAFERARRDDPQSAEAVYGLGSVYLDQNKMTQARDCFQQTLKLNASYPDTVPNAWNNLGLIAAREGHTDQAISYFQRALSLSPDHTIALVNLGSAYRQLKRWQESRKSLESALAIHPDDPEANYGLAMVFAQTEDTDHAYEYLQRALKARPNYPEALNNLGILYLRTQRPEQAISTFEECIRVAPSYDQAYLNLARVYVIEEDREKARAILLSLLKEHPQHAQARQMLEELQ